MQTATNGYTHIRQNDFKTKQNEIARDKEGHFMIKRVIHQEDLTITYLPLTPEFQNTSSKKMTELKEERDNPTKLEISILPFSIKDKTTKNTINKEIEDLNNTIKQSDLKTIYLTTAEHTFFSKCS